MEKATLADLVQAPAILMQWVEHDNTERLHAGLGCLTPADFYCGNSAARIEERRSKLAMARRERQRINDERLTRAA